MGIPFENLVRNVQSKLHILFLKKADNNPGRSAMVEAAKIPWSWVAINIAKVLSEYPTGLTDAVLLSMLELMWEKTFIQRFKGFDKITDEAKNRELDIYMHPRFNDWIAYSNDNRQFFADRKIRIICPPKANAPILAKHKDTKIARRYRVALIPPTELLLIMLDRTDKAFVLREFPDRIRDISAKSNYRFWLKIIHVEVFVHITPTPNLDPTEEAKSQRTDIFLVDMSSDCVPVVLSLYDKQTKLASIFRRNDYIGLHQPVLKQSTGSQEFVFEYAIDTTIFLMPEKEAQEASLAKVNLTTLASQDDAFSYTDPKKDIAERDEEGFMDCSNYTQRIYLQDLSHRMLNVTLLGKVVGLANNNPFIKQKDGGTSQKMDRYAVRLTDSTDTMDITLWEEAGHDSRRLRVGQYVLLDHLVTSDRHQSKTNNKMIWYINGSVVCGTKIYNSKYHCNHGWVSTNGMTVSTLSCLITSSSFRSTIPLWHAKENKMDHFQAEGMIVGWELFLNSGQKGQSVLSNTCSQSTEIDFLDYSLSDRITTSAHARCLLPRNGNDCEFCGCQIGNEVTHIFRPKPAVADAAPNNSSTSSSSSSSSSNVHQRGWEGWLQWTLDDGTSVCSIYGGEETILNVTASHFKSMSHQSQIQLLNSVLGTQILCSLSGNGTSTYRLEQMTLFEPTEQECRFLLEALSKK
ncbi:Heat shock protein ssb1 [Mucor velutinosus]|uniref:Heat shock protein ssb1 n=1 Tax=Mucor velutinosus TaxID=708070 RepID=A0AAN7HYX0_9FUNG|nr:Heat shock protein ssb1 [Mucor velutinosus]